MQVLVDTSVWSLALRRRKRVESPEIDCLKQLVSDGRVEIIGAIRQEILSGIREPLQFERLKEALCPFIDTELETSDYEEAAKISNTCLSSGIQTGTIDCLITSVAIRRNWEILTTDNDFHHMASCVDLKLHTIVPKNSH